MFKDYMIQACLWTNLLYSISYPYIHMFIMKQANEKLISLNEILICVFTIIINSIWNKYSDKLYKTFPVFMFMESALYLVLYALIIMGFVNGIVFYIIDTILFCLITRNIICGGNKLKSVIYKDELREKYDNTICIAASIGTLIGASIAFFVDVPLWVAFIISQTGITIDNIFYYIAYKKNARNSKESHENKMD